MNRLMSMQRFYLPTLGFKGDVMSIDDSRVVHQCCKVLRMRPGDHFRLFDGAMEFEVEVLEISKKVLLVKKNLLFQNEADPVLEVSLYQAIPKKPALFELIVQKATEIGVSEIFPLVTERTENRRLAKVERLALIAMEAAEQCGRLRVPTIHSPVIFNDAIHDARHAFMAAVSESQKTLQDFRADFEGEGPIQLFIGPEGGFSSGELTLAQSKAIQCFSLGNRILRTETAAMSSLSLMLLG